MDIGKLFSQAWGLFVKDIGPLIVGALIAGIVPAIAATIVLIATLGATFATSTVSSEGDVTSVSPAGWALLAVGMTLVVVVAVLLSAPLYAGLVLGVIRRVRENREMGYGDTFQGFSLFGPVVGVTVLITVIMIGIFLAPVVLAIAAAAASSTLLGVLAAVVAIAATVAAVYLSTRWVYAIPLVVDQRTTATDALRESGVEVKRTGWWITFLALIVMGIVVSIVGGVLGLIPFVGTVASLLLTPFSLTYIIAMYFQSRGENALVDGVLRRVGPASWPAAPSGGAAQYPPAPPMGAAYPPSPVEPHPSVPSQYPAAQYPPVPSAPAPLVPPAPEASAPSTPVPPPSDASVPVPPPEPPAGESPEAPSRPAG